MDWYYCQECGAVFSAEDIVVETVENRHWWLDDCPVERWTEYSCPECGSSDVEEAEYCEYCGEPFRPEDLTDGVRTMQSRKQCMKGENMTEKEYRSHPALSRSELWQFHRSAEWFKWKREHPSEPTPALLFGQVAHKLLLEPDTFDDEFAVAPVVDKRTKEGKAVWLEFCANAADKTVVDAETYNQAYSMTDVAFGNDLVCNLISGRHEEAFFWTDPDTGVQCKARLDSWHRDEQGVPVVVDYKTTNDASYRAFQRDVEKWGYYFQAAMYSEALIQNGLCPRRIKGKPKKRWRKDHDTGKRQYWTEYPEKIVMGGSEGEIIHPRFIFIVQEKDEPYLLNIFEMDLDYMSLGYDLYREYLGTYASCESIGYYPGYLGPTNEPNILTLPSWMNRGDDS